MTFASCAETGALLGVRTLRLKVRGQSNPWLLAAAAEINTCGNYANEISYAAARAYVGKRKLLSTFDLGGHKRQAKRWQRRVKRQRIDVLNEFPTKIVQTYQNTIIADVSSLKLVKTRMSKSVLDAGWGTLSTQLQYTSQQAGRSVFIVNEAYTTRACSCCQALPGPTGLDMLVVSTGVCSGWGDVHDRNVNSGINILCAWRLSTSVGGNELSPSEAPPRQTSRLREPRSSAWTAAA